MAAGSSFYLIKTTHWTKPAGLPGQTNLIQANSGGSLFSIRADVSSLWQYFVGIIENIMKWIGGDRSA